MLLELVMHAGPLRTAALSGEREAGRRPLPLGTPVVLLHDGPDRVRPRHAFCGACLTILVAPTGCGTTTPPAVEAILRNDLPALNAQLDAGASPRTTTHGGAFSLMLYSISGRHWDMVDLLEQRGASLYDDDAIEVAFMRPDLFKLDEETLKRLMARGLDLNKPLGASGGRPLDWTCLSPERTQLLVKYGALVNAPRTSQETIYPNSLFSCLAALRGFNRIFR